ncbi:uncharacterized protein LOC117221652 [Megalopta genalis]|uniref:uncharacterized protein LOC117221652 n=1 Tax=Megalopta genalis TaxID=115081 RepID=UPI00144322B7|nr:uncharacterized protein LOC117221652 [Megalopta genalis]
MDHISEVPSSSQNDSVYNTASNLKYRENSISSEEQSLLELVQKGITDETNENVAFQKEILPLLSKLKLEPEFLSNDIKDGLQKVVSILKFERLSDFDKTDLKIVCERKKVEEAKREREEKQLALLYDNVYRKYTKFSKKLMTLQEAVNDIEELVQEGLKDEEERHCKQVFLTTKLKDYKQTVEELEADVAEMQVEDLYPEKILNKYNKYLEMTGELAEIDQCLSQYKDLPPNLLQAKALLEVKRKEYETVEKEFYERTTNF